MDRRLFVVAALALAGCATVPAAPPRPSPPYEELEPVYGVRADGEGLIIRVRSGGCTGKADFAVYVERRGDAVELAFGRKRIDVCQGAPAPAEIAFTWAELGLAPQTPVFLLNPVRAGAGPGE